MITFFSVLITKLLTGSIGYWSENCYHTHQHLAAAIGMTFCVAVGIPVSWLVFVDRDPAAISALLIAVAVTTYRGSMDLEKRKSAK